MKNIITQLLTGKDGYTHDVVRWLGVLAVLVALGLAIYVVAWKNQAFDIQSFGLGIGTVFASLGAALKLKENTEPTP